MTPLAEATECRRPPAWEEALASRLFRLLEPRLRLETKLEPRPGLKPWRFVDIPRAPRQRPLTGTWFPAPEPARGAVLLLPPWQPWGRAYFHRRGRLQRLRSAGYHSLTVDLPNFVHGVRSEGFYDRDIAAAATYLSQRCPGLPLHLWGISSGGYWAHAVLGRQDGFTAAMFEDVSPHLLEWAWHVAPWGRPCYLFFKSVFRRSYRFLDARRHAANLRLERASYVTGGSDPGIPVHSAKELAAVGHRRLLVIPKAAHLEAIKRARAEVLDLALATFA